MARSLLVAMPRKIPRLFISPRKSDSAGLRKYFRRIKMNRPYRATPASPAPPSGQETEKYPRNTEQSPYSSFLQYPYEMRPVRKDDIFHIDPVDLRPDPHRVHKRPSISNITAFFPVSIIFPPLLLSVCGYSPGFSHSSRERLPIRRRFR